ncbi:MAG: hypothetical protein AAB518_02625 [Patescibacteria group bacterium]
MKKISFALVIILLLTVSFGIGSTIRYVRERTTQVTAYPSLLRGEDTEKKVLKNDEYGFRVSYPKAWIATPVSVTPGLAGEIGSYAISFCISLPNPCAEAQIQILDIALDEYLRVRMGTNFVLEERKSTMLGGISGEQLIIKNVASGELTKETIAFRNGHLYVIRGNASDDLQGAYQILKDAFTFLFSPSI